MTTPPPGEAGWMQRLENLARAQEWAAMVERLADVDVPVKPLSAAVRDEQARTGVTGVRTVWGDRGGFVSEEFARGGYVGSGSRSGEPWVVIASEECLLRPPFDGRAVCTRPSHPTPTSDCSTEDWIRHVSEEAE